MSTDNVSITNTPPAELQRELLALVNAVADELQHGRQARAAAGLDSSLAQKLRHRQLGAG